MMMLELQEQFYTISADQVDIESHIDECVV
jgi:hypothetical protein